MEKKKKISILLLSEPMKYIKIGLDKSGFQVNSFLISQQKHMLWYSLEAPYWGASNEYPQHIFLSRNKKNIDTFWLKKSTTTKKKNAWSRAEHFLHCSMYGQI